MGDRQASTAAALGITVAIAVADLDAAVTHFRNTFGLGEPAYAVSQADKVKVAVFSFGTSQLQLVTPTADDSLIARHLADRGEGLHHMGFIVDDANAMLRQVRERGSRTLSDEGQPGAGDFRVGFVHPKSAYGTVLELIQTSSAAGADVRASAAGPVTDAVQEHR